MPAPPLDILFSKGNGSMESASLEALAYMLADPQSSRTLTGINVDDLSGTFLLFFHSFCDPIFLAKALISRHEEQPIGLNNFQHEAWSLKWRIWVPVGGCSTLGH
jgi:hypothetical protein